MLNVYAAIVHLADGRKQFTPNRQDIADVCKVCTRIVGRAIDALHDARWINRAYGHEGKRTWYRITFPKGGTPIGYRDEGNLAPARETRSLSDYEGPKPPDGLLAHVSWGVILATNMIGMVVGAIIAVSISGSAEEAGVVEAGGATIGLVIVLITLGLVELRLRLVERSRR